MTLRRALIIGVAVTTMLSPRLQAQTSTTTKEKGAAQVTTSTLTGEVLMVEGHLLVVKVRPSGLIRVFDVPPGRQFTIDGQTKQLADLKVGTVLTATVTTTTTPVTVRTTTVTNGRVEMVAGQYVVLTLENGESRGYDVPSSYRFTVDGKQVSAMELKKGMKVSGTKIVEDPHTEFSTQTVVTGTAPGAKPASTAKPATSKPPAPPK